MKYILILLFSFTLQAQSLLLLFDDEADSTTTLPPAVWSQDPTLQMFTNATPTLGNELVTNGDLEVNTAGWASPTRASFVISSDYAHLGNYSGKLIKDATGSTGYTYIEQATTVNTYYLISAYLRNNTASQIALSEKYSTAGYLQIGSAITSTSWTVVNSVRCATNAISGILVAATGTNGQTGYIDNVSVKPLTNFTPPAYANDYSAGGIVEGNDLLAGWDFTSGWTAVGANTSITDNNTFTTTDNGGIVLSNFLTVGNYYLKGYFRSTTAGNSRYLELNDAATMATSFYALNNYIVSKSVYRNVYLQNVGAGTTDVTSVSTKLLTNGIPGIFNGGMETVQPGTNSTGIEKGFIFDGVDDYIAVECTTSTTNSTLSAWVNFTTTGAERYIFGTTTGYVRKSNTEVIQASSGTIYVDGQPYSGSAITAGWHLVTVTGIALSGTQLNIGASITPGGYLSGFIDKAGRYNGTLSANQVLKLYNDTKSRYGL